MKHVYGRRRLTWRAGFAALTIGLACAAAGTAAAPALAQVRGHLERPGPGLSPA